MKTTTNKSGWLGGVTSFLASAVGLVCPACIPALASLLASLGIGFAAKEQFIRPVLLALLAVAVAAFAWSAKLHRHWWIVATGVGGGVLVYLGRYFEFGELRQGGAPPTTLYQTGAIARFLVGRNPPHPEPARTGERDLSMRSGHCGNHARGNATEAR